MAWELPQEKRARLMRLPAVDYFQAALPMRHVAWLFVIVVLAMVADFLIVAAGGWELLLVALLVHVMLGVLLVRWHARYWGGFRGL